MSFFAFTTQGKPSYPVAMRTAAPLIASQSSRRRAPCAGLLGRRPFQAYMPESVVTQACSRDPTPTPTSVDLPLPGRFGETLVHTAPGPLKRSGPLPGVRVITTPPSFTTHGSPSGPTETAVAAPPTGSQVCVPLPGTQRITWWPPGTVALARPHTDPSVPAAMSTRPSTPRTFGSWPRSQFLAPRGLR